MEVGAINTEGIERTFLLSTTHGAEMTGLGAFIETVRIYRTEDVTGHLWSYGKQLREGMTALAAKHGLQAHFQMDGPAISMNYLTRDRNGALSMPLRTLFAQEMLKAGVMMPWLAVSQAHGPDELALTLDAVDQALAVFARALDGQVGDYLQGPARLRW
jgi:glutamate-1-semialdehyde 2,1-aminomutase